MSTRHVRQMDATRNALDGQIEGDCDPLACCEIYARELAGLCDSVESGISTTHLTSSQVAFAVN